MRQYEILFIVSPNSSTDELKDVATKFQNVITGMEGVVTSYDEQGKTRLAYDVKKENKGYYVLMEFVGSADIVAEVERNMRLDDRVLKYLTVKLTDQVDPASVKPLEQKSPEPTETDERREAEEAQEAEEAESSVAQESEESSEEES